MAGEPQSFHTFKKNRKCPHCGTAIPDQNHGKQLYCSRVVLPDGSIKSCKDDYHYPKSKAANEPFKKMMEYHNSKAMPPCSQSYYIY
jgi:hypothetical protein